MNIVVSEDLFLLRICFISANFLLFCRLLIRNRAISTVLNTRIVLPLRTLKKAGNACSELRKCVNLTATDRSMHLSFVFYRNSISDFIL